MILDRIVEQKKKEVELAKSLYSINRLKNTRELPPTRSLSKALSNTNSVGLIAEVKKGSPSKGIIKADFDPVAIAKTYTLAGASAISVLTDATFFYGNPGYLKMIRRVTELPLLRKDFIIDEWQIYESLSLGADAILLIAAVLEDDRLTEFILLAAELGLESLVEIHTEEELERVMELPVTLLGINNRNLQNFKTDIQITVRLCTQLNKVKTDTQFKIVSESGINSGEDVRLLREAGVHGILVGESLMRADDIPGKIRELIELEY